MELITSSRQNHGHNLVISDENEELEVKSNVGTDDSSLRDVVMTNLTNRLIRTIVEHAYLNKENIGQKELMPHLVTVQGFQPHTDNLFNHR